MASTQDSSRKKRSQHEKKQRAYLPYKLTKDVCYQQNSKLYKSQKYIACYRNDESLYHIAECEIYQKIWDNLEKEAIQLTKLEASTKLSLAISETLLREAIYGKDTSTKINCRKMLLRGFTNNKQQKEVFKTT